MPTAKRAALGVVACVALLPPQKLDLLRLNL